MVAETEESDDSDTFSEDDPTLLNGHLGAHVTHHPVHHSHHATHHPPHGGGHGMPTPGGILPPSPLPGFGIPFGGERPPLVVIREAPPPPSAAAPVTPGARFRMSDSSTAWGIRETPEVADDLFAAFPLELPVMELPRENETLSLSDIAAVLVVGGRTRANLVPQRGSQLSGVATILASDDETVREGEESPLAGLFIDPVGGARRPWATDASLASQRAPRQPRDESDRPSLGYQGTALVLAIGAMWVAFRSTSSKNLAERGMRAIRG